jgi:hypothetical protein
MGCSVKKPTIGKKAIPNEDEYIIKALFYEENNNLPAAIETYKFLYKKRKKAFIMKRW